MKPHTKWCILKLPDFAALQGAYIIDRNDGIQAVEHSELDNAKLAEGEEYVTSRCVTYFGIPNFRYEISVFFEAAEALKMIGLA